MTSEERARPFGLSDLPGIRLDPEHQAVLDVAARVNLGGPEWRARKLAEVRELLALCQIAPRLELLALDMSTDVQVRLRIRTAVPCLPPGANELIVLDEAQIVLNYPESVLHGPISGSMSVCVASPPFCHHPNVAGGPSLQAGAQWMCMGVRIQRGWPLVELVLATYGALTMQSVTLDRADPAGVMNPSAAEWWESNQHLIPLSREAFLQGGGR